MTLPRWHWLNDGVVPLLVVLVRLSWIWPWLEMLRRWLTGSAPEPWLPLWSLPLLLLGGTVAARLAGEQERPIAVTRVWVAGSGLLVILVLIWWRLTAGQTALVDLRWFALLVAEVTRWEGELSPVLFALFVAAGLWMRGVADASARRTRDDVWRTCATAYAAFALLAVAGQLDRGGLPAGAEQWVMVLVASSLSALALSSLELARSVRAWGSDRGAPPALSRDWLVSVAVVIGLMLVVGLGLGALITPGTAVQVLEWVAIPLRWLATLVGYVILALTYVLFLILTPLIEWLRAQLAEQEPREAQETGFGQQLEELTSQSPFALSPAAEESLRWLGVVGLLVVMAIAIALLVRFYRRERENDPDETRETILTGDLLQEQMVALWRRLRAWGRGRRRAIAPFLGLDGEEASRRALRALYQQLLALASAAGLARLPDQTPREYMGRLAARWPGHDAAWMTITQAYIMARYGERLPEAAQVGAAQEAWAEVAPAVTQSQPESANHPDSEEGAGTRREHPVAF